MNNEIYIDTRLDTDNIEKDAAKIDEAMKKMADKASKSAEEIEENYKKKFGEVKEEAESFGKKKFDEPTLSEGKLSKEYIDAAKEADKLSKKLDQLIEKEIRFMETGGNKDSRTFKGYEYDIDRAREKIADLEAQMKQMRSNGTAFEKIAESEEVLEEETEEVTKKVSRFGSIIKSGLMGSARIAGKAFSGLGNVIKNGFVKAIKLGEKALESIKNKLSKHNSGINTGIKNLLKYVLGWKLLEKGIRNISKYYQEGFQNLAKFNNGQNAVNRAASNLQSAMTTFGNSLAAAFSPILTVIEPIITGFINKLTELANTFGMVIAKLTGQNSFTKAIQVQKDYAKSLEGSSKAAKGSLAAFDELNTLQDQSGSGSLESAEMFENVEIGKIDIPIVDMLKEAWKKADFTEIGSLFGNKIKESLDSIQWGGIQESARNIASSIATFINGFVETEGLGTSIGTTIGEGFNTALYFVQEFVQDLDWKSIGKTIADSLNGLSDSIDWKAIGKTFSDGVKGVLDLLITAFEGTDWWKLGENVKKAFENVDWNGIADKTFELLGAAFGSLAAFAGGLFQEAFDGIYDYFSKEIEEAGGNVVEGILMGIAKGLVSIGDWIKDHIFKPFLDGFKKVFGIHSPSTVMAEQGEYLMEGVKKGIKDKIQSVIDAIVELWDKMKKKTFSAVNAIKESVQTVFGAMKDKVAKIFEDMWSAVKGTINWILSGIESMANGIVRGLNKVIDSLNKLKVDAPDWVTDLTGITSIGFNIPNIPEISIPKLATGNVIPRQAKEKAYILGDNNRETEVVSPLSTMKEAMIEALSEGDFNGREITIEIPLYLDGKQIHKEVVRVDRDYAKKTGNSAFAY